jgi:MFS transporter, UMF1 family
MASVPTHPVLLGLIMDGTLAVLARETPQFWVAGLALGVFVGPVQSASRAMMARMTPGESAAGHFGLYALSGRVTAFLGPAVAAAVTSLSGSQRYGMAAIILFLVAGFALLLMVREPSPAPPRCAEAAGPTAAPPDLAARHGRG